MHTLQMKMHVNPCTHAHTRTHTSDENSQLMTVGDTFFVSSILYLEHFLHEAISRSEAKNYLVKYQSEIFR